MATKTLNPQFSFDAVTESAATDLSVSPARVLLVIPGIRDSKDLARLIQEIDPRFSRDFVFCPVDYGRYGRTMFLRGLASQAPRERAIARVKEDIERYQRMYPDAEFHALCYSNGTYLFSKTAHFLSKRWTNVAFVGSICHRSAAETIVNRATRFVNFAGTLDPWPVVATTASRSLFGATGTHGFRASLDESFLPIGHYGVIDPIVVKEFLYPFFTNDKVRAMKVQPRPAAALHPDAIRRYLIWLVSTAVILLILGLFYISSAQSSE